VNRRPVRVEVCVGAAIFRGGRLLLLRRAESRVAFPGLWDIPGGHVEPGESLAAALRREVREETGFDLRIGRPFQAGFFEYPRPGGRRALTLEVDYLGGVRGKRPPRLDPNEHCEFAWVARYSARKYPAPPLLRRILRAAYAAHRASR